MLQEFTVENFRSIGNHVKVLLEANGGIKDIIQGGDGAGYYELANRLRLLTVMSFYGYNSSGKSNLLMSLHRMKDIVRHAVRLNESEMLPYEPFLLIGGREQEPTMFEVVFTKGRNIYRYGFCYTATQIVKEWLAVKMPGKSLKEMFLRVGNQWNRENPNFPEGNISNSINNNRLLISLLGQLGGEISNAVLDWFMHDLTVFSGSEDGYMEFSRNLLLNDSETRQRMMNLVKELNLGFSDMKARMVSVDEMGLPEGLPSSFVEQLRAHPPIEVRTTHNVYNEAGEVIGAKSMMLDRVESEGTKKLFGMSGLIARALLEGSTLVVDEFDSKIHPMLCRKIVAMFNDPTQNTTGAQLVFATHDTNLLDSQLLRRDQIMFVKKGRCECTRVYGLLDVKLDNGQKPRNDSNYEKNYLQERYEMEV